MIELFYTALFSGVIGFGVGYILALIDKSKWR